MPAPNTSKVDVPPINEKRKSVAVFMSKAERHRFKQHAANFDRTMSDLAREKFQEYRERNPDMDANILPDYKADSPPPISEDRRNLVVFISDEDHHWFRMLSATMGRPMSSLARDIIALYICEKPTLNTS